MVASIAQTDCRWKGVLSVGTIVTGVTASLDLLRAARERGGYAVLVHPGYFWCGESRCSAEFARHSSFARSHVKSQLVWEERRLSLVIPIVRSAMLRGGPALVR